MTRLNLEAESVFFCFRFDFGFFSVPANSDSSLFPESSLFPTTTMASKRPGEDENNGHAAAGDGPDAKKSKSVREPARRPLALLCSRAWVSSPCNDPERQGAVKGILLTTELLDLVEGLGSSHILRLRAKGSRWSCALLLRLQIYQITDPWLN